MNQYNFKHLYFLSALCVSLLGIPLTSAAQAPMRANTEPLQPEYQLHEDGSVSLRVCYNASCAGQKTMTFTADDMQQVFAQMDVCPTNSVEYGLQRVRIGIWQMELLARKYYPPLGNDLPVNDQEFGVEGRTDCVDNSSNTTTFLSVLQDLGQLPGWSVQSPSVRKPWDINRVHWTAVAKDSGSKLWSVDSWFRRHGHLPFVMPLGNWKREELAWEGVHNARNPYPKSTVELCSP